MLFISKYLNQMQKNECFLQGLLLIYISLFGNITVFEQVKLFIHIILFEKKM